MKKLLAILTVMVLMFALAACGQSSSSIASSESNTPESAATEGDAVYSIAISINALDAFMTEWYGYLDAYLTGLGHKVNMTNAEGSLEKQISDVEALIQTAPDVIFINAVNTEGIVPAFEACTAAGIPVIDHTLKVPYEDTLHLMFLQTIQGQMQAEWCLEWLENNPGETIRAGYLMGNAGSENAQERLAGWKERCEEGAGDNFTLLAEKVCDWSASQAMAAVEDWMQAHPDMNFIVACNDEMAIAAVNVVWKRRAKPVK